MVPLASAVALQDPSASQMRPARFTKANGVVDDAIQAVVALQRSDAHNPDARHVLVKSAAMPARSESARFSCARVKLARDSTQSLQTLQGVRIQLLVRVHVTTPVPASHSQYAEVVVLRSHM